MTPSGTWRASKPQRLALRWLAGTGCLLWAWSWYTMYLEIFRWGHVTRHLRFDSTPVPGTSIRPKPGRPLKALFVCFFGAPALVILSVVRERTLRAQGARTSADLWPPDAA